ncbi:hypothetical protein H4CHR_03745 [Variovorax sp. PBS-H4]|uniref:hypothetical protein n=1 Tax=Variovorax sp. PBS-H4 TaxID=434008 RepID=UPI0013177299|nr:hypothetical protein [Variovorax sp. PBS-H4]VTU35778.1 hypothetical protein H4CHR_03745 [Variovorax sp. PBS-H4]
MEVAAFVLSTLALAGLIVVGLLSRTFLPAYMTEKGKNLASKEDLAHLTHTVERIKAQQTAEIERLKADLQAEGSATERRRKVYEEMCGALRVFVAGHGNSPEAKDRFHAAYAAAWLWASDSTLTALHHFMKLQAEHAASPGTVGQELLKAAYAEAVLAMRKDAGFSVTNIGASDYQFVQF